MLQVLKANDRARADRLLTEQTKAVHAAFLAFVRACQKIDLAEMNGHGGVEAILRLVDREIERFANAWPAAFLASANVVAAQLSRRLRAKAAATVAIDFNPGHPEAARLMESNRLNLVRDLSQQQREIVRQALTTGLARGEGTAAIARRFANAIGLSPAQAQQLDTYRRSLEASRSPIDAGLVGPGEAPAVDVLSPTQVERMVAAQQKQMVAARAETIARTEALRVTALAQDQALRQNLRATGQSAALTGKTWNSAHDSRTRETHSSADGQRRRLNDTFSIGGEQMDKPGEGSAANSINCRCVLTFEFFDSEQELTEWLAGGS